MPFVIAQPAMLSAAADNLGVVRFEMTALNAKLAPTTRVDLAPGEEVSVLIAAHFVEHRVRHPAVSAQAAAIHEMSVTALAPSTARLRPPTQPTPSRLAETRP